MNFFILYLQLAVPAATTVSVTAAPSVPDLKKMTTFLEGNTETGFLFATLREFLHLWKSGKEGSLTLKCKNGRNSMKFQAGLGYPDQPHIQDGRRRKRHRGKTDIRKSRDNARAAAFQAARAPPSATATPATPPAGQDVPPLVPPALPPAERDLDKSPPQSHQLTTPSPSQQPPPRHTSPLHTPPLPGALPSSPGETSQRKKAESVETRSGRTEPGAR